MYIRILPILLLITWDNFYPLYLDFYPVIHFNQEYKQKVTTITSINSLRFSDVKPFPVQK